MNSPKDLSLNPTAIVKSQVSLQIETSKHNFDKDVDMKSVSSSNYDSDSDINVVDEDDDIIIDVETIDYESPLANANKNQFDNADCNKKITPPNPVQYNKFEDQLFNESTDPSGM